jgi:hypothetical protein
MYTKPHINGISSRVPIRSGVQLSGPCRRPATQHCPPMHESLPLPFPPTAPARNSARKLISSLVPRLRGRAFGGGVIRFRCDCRLRAVHCSSLQRPPLPKETKDIPLAFIDELVQYRNCNRSARPTGQYPEALATVFTSFTPVHSDWNVAVTH